MTDAQQELLDRVRARRVLPAPAERRQIREAAERHAARACEGARRAADLCLAVGAGREAARLAARGRVRGLAAAAEGGGFVTDNSRPAVGLEGRAARPRRPLKGLEPPTCRGPLYFTERNTQ